MSHVGRVHSRETDVAIVCALDMESRAFVQRLRRNRTTIGHRFRLTQGTLAGRSIAVLRLGADRKGRLGALDALVGVHRPRWVIAAGFGVGLSPAAHRGDILVATHLAADGARELAVNARVAAHDERGQAVRTGRLLSLPRWPRSQARKQELHDRTAAVAADVHSYGIAQYCAERGIRFLAIRVLVDDALGESPRELRVVLHPSLSFRAGGVIGSLLSGRATPSVLLDVRRRTKEYAEQLARFVETIVDEL